MAKKNPIKVQVVEYAAIPPYPTTPEEQDALRAAAEQALGRWLTDGYELLSTAVGNRANAMTVVWTLAKTAG